MLTNQTTKLVSKINYEENYVILVNKQILDTTSLYTVVLTNWKAKGPVCQFFLIKYIYKRDQKLMFDEQSWCMATRKACHPTKIHYTEIIYINHHSELGYGMWFLFKLVMHLQHPPQVDSIIIYINHHSDVRYDKWFFQIIVQISHALQDPSQVDSMEYITHQLELRFDIWFFQSFFKSVTHYSMLDNSIPHETTYVLPNWSSLELS